MRIRAVDDSELILDIYRIWARDNDVELLGAVEDLTGRTLFHQAAWEGVDVALVDMQLGRPDMTGFDVLRWLKLNAPQVRRIVVSAVVSAADADALEREGLADRVVPKGPGVFQVLEA